MTLREKALRIAISKIGTHERGFNNHGPQVDKFQQADDIPGEGYAWCCSFVQWCFRQSGRALPNRTASVGKLLEWAHMSYMQVNRPFRGDLVCFYFDSDNWPDHIGFVEKVLSLGPVMILRTVEGNTSPGDSGSQDDGGGVYRRRRVVRRDRVAFIRIPGEVPKPRPRVVPVHKPKRKRQP